MMDIGRGIIGGHRSMLAAAATALALLAGFGRAQAVVYTNVTAAAQINYVQNTGYASGPRYMTGGAAAADYDNDGWIDLYVTRLDAPDILYRNRGDGTFQDVSVSAGFTANIATNGPAWGDIDNDGDQDLYVTGSGTTRFYLYINDGAGHFTEQAVARGADVSGVPRYGQSVTYGDYDGDGYLDIHTNDWGIDTSLSNSRLLHNLGAANPGHFEDVTAAAGLDVYRTSSFYGGYTDTNAYRFSSTFTDLDRDGRPDILIAGDFVTSQVFWNNGDGTFTDGTLPAGIGTGEDSMGLTVGDYNGDGLLDFFETNLVDSPGEIFDHSGNRLFLNNGDRTFTDQTDAGGLRDTGWSWGTTFLDHDNDRDLDLFVTNGWDTTFGDQTHIYQNDNGVFTDISNASGVTDTDQGRGLLSFDYDNDGDLDTFIVNHGEAPILYRNDGGNDNDWIKIKAQGTASNRDGIGTLITIDPDTGIAGDEMTRELNAGSNYLSQNDITVHFGLGLNADNIDRITILWPSGTTQELSNVSVNQLLELLEPLMAGDLNGDGFVGIADLNIVLGNWNQIVIAASQLMGDVTGDGFVGIADLNAVLGNWNTGSPPSNESLAQVPEPVASYFLIVSVLAGLHRRRAPAPASTTI